MLANTISLESNWSGLISEHERTCALKHPSKCIKQNVIHQFQAIASQIDYKENWFVKVIDHDGWMVMQIQTLMTDSGTGKPFDNNSRPLI
jgi:hypothetical protein